MPTPTHGGHITSRHELQTLLQPVLCQTPTNLVVFLQDTLSVDDFTYLSATSGQEKPYPHLQDLLNSSASSLVLPAVDWKAISDLVGFLEKQEDWHQVDVGKSDEVDFKTSDSKPNFMIVKLLSRIRDSDASAGGSFNENDKKIEKLTNIMRERGIEFTAIYSALRPSKIHRTAGMTSETRRRLLSTDRIQTVPYPPLNVTNGTETCIIFYATNLTLTVNESVQLDLTHQTFVSHVVDTSSSKCSEFNTTFSLKYYNLTKEINTLEIRFAMSNQFYPGSARNWFTLDSVQILQDARLPGALFRIPYASSPAEYSFHCQLVGTSQLYDAVLIPTNAEAKAWNVHISQFQIQGFNVKDSLFSYSTDCTGFFSAAIWMALVSSFVLLWILAYGIYMLMNLTTNDKFDDPKGHPLSVGQGE
ncbi:V-type proton ATPase subunit S1-like isoform X2 [Ambystoma mexicanum]